MQTTKKIDSNATTVKSSTEEINILKSLGNDLKKYSEMSEQDRAFLNTLVLRKQPLRLLELGVCSGGSSLVMLNAIKNIEGSHLYSIDYNTQHYKLKDKLTGFYVDNFPELKEKWTLKTGGLALNFMNEIGGDIDFCLIDTVHANPGEILDFLMVLPYLKQNATVVFHDTNLHARVSEESYVYLQYTNNLLMSAISGTKLLPAATTNTNNYNFINIGAIELNQTTFEHIWEIFNLLTIKWTYLHKDYEFIKLTDFIQKYYGERYSNYFHKVLSFQKDVKNLNDKINKEQISLKQIQNIFQNLENKIQYLHQEIKLHKNKSTFWQKIFSVKNEYAVKQKHKIITLLGLKIKIKAADMSAASHTDLQQ